MESVQAEDPTNAAADILRVVGWTLVVVGVLDIGLMAYCVTHDMNYQSPLNIFAIGAGILLLRQSLRAAKVVAWVAAFYLALFAGGILFALAHLMREASGPDLSILDVSYVAAMFAFFAWLYRSLTAESVLAACAATGLSRRKPVSGFVVGGVLVIELVIALYGFGLWGR